MLNEEIIDWFGLLIKQLEYYVDVNTGQEKCIYEYKLNSIRNALITLSNIKFKITSGSQLKGYPNIGKGTIRRIDEILTTGKLVEVNESDITGKHLNYVEDLMRVYGIGRIKAYKLYKNYGIKSIEDLKNAIRKGTIDLPDIIIKGIRYVDKIKTKIPRQEMDQIYSYLLLTGIEFDNNMDVRMCGSYRREKETSNDIDIIISHPDIKTTEQSEKSDLMRRFINLLEKKNFIIDSFTSESVTTLYMGICRLTKDLPMRRIDIRCFSQESYYTAILHFTGSAHFNRRMRNVALIMGYSLNEYRLLDDKGKPFKIKSEKDVFDYLKMDYVVPSERI